MLTHSKDPAHSLSGRVRKTLIERIATGHYKSGERLIEMKLAEEFGTSQLPIREALRDLELAVAHLAFERVVALDEQTIEQRPVAEHLLDEQQARILVHARMDPAHELLAIQAAQSHNIERMIDHSIQFHRTIVAAAGNELLLKLWDSLHLEIHTRVTLSEPGIDFMAAAISHQPIVDAIKAGDVELACRLSREHQAYFEHWLNV